MAHEALLTALTARYGVHLPAELVDVWAEPESLLDDEPLVRLLARLAPHRRAIWVPDVVADEGTVGTSRYGGVPWLLAGEEWPSCPLCKRSMHLFVQIVASEVPGEARALVGVGVVQLFYCAWQDTLCCLETDAFEPFAASVVARRIAPDAPPRSLPIPPFDAPVNPVRIAGWKEQPDYPSVWELDVLTGMDDATGDVDLATIDLQVNEVGDKLGGWASWVQREDAPRCPRCGAIMRLVFQLGSASHLRLDYGGGAIGYLTRCETHDDVLAFSWQR